MKDRQQDEQHLEWLRARTEGHTSGEIAAQHGTLSANVRIVTNRIRAADLAESGDPAADAAYW